MLSIYRLPNQTAGEQVIEVVRRDIFILVKKAALFILLACFPLVFYLLIAEPSTELAKRVFLYPLILVIASSYYLFIWLFFFFSFIDYYLDVWIITSERIIDVNQKGFFSRTIAEQRLARVQDITSEQHGMLPTIFDYGDVYVQTAGEVQRFYFHEVPDPERIRNVIIRLSEHNKKMHKDELV